MKERQRDEQRERYELTKKWRGKAKGGWKRNKERQGD